MNLTEQAVPSSLIVTELADVMELAPSVVTDLDAYALILFATLYALTLREYVVLADRPLMVFVTLVADPLLKVV